MKATKLFLSIAVSLFAICFCACGDAAKSGGEADVSSAAADPEEAVSYEPAYPEDVSPEALSEEDVSQQEASHGHGEGDSHSHGDEDHAHAGEGDEDHGHPH